MQFGIIFGIEGALIGLSSALLGRLGCAYWVLPMMAVIIGLHFLPLAYVFKTTLHKWTGATIVGGALLCVLIQNVGQRITAVAFTLAATLWSTPALLLLRTKPDTAVKSSPSSVV